MRAASVVTVVLGMVSSRRYVVLQNQSKFSTIQSAAADLPASCDDITFTNDQSGLTFNNLIPDDSLTPSNGYPISKILAERR